MPIIKANTPEECKEKIINFLKENGRNYHIRANTARLKKDRDLARAKADTCMGIALFIDECRIERTE